MYLICNPLYIQTLLLLLLLLSLLGLDSLDNQLLSICAQPKSLLNLRVCDQIFSELCYYLTKFFT